MRQLVILFLEFVLIIGLVVGIYYVNLSKKENYLYNKPLLATHLHLSDFKLEEELFFFLSKQLGIYGEVFQILEVVFLHTNDITGLDYILVTLRTSDGSLCQITLSRNFPLWGKWELNPENFSVVKPLQPIFDSPIEVPKWMQDLGVTLEQIEKYYAAHPETIQKGETAFFDEKTGKYNLPSDWFQTVYTLSIEKDKTMRLISDKGVKAKVTLVNSYWKADYPTEYLGLGYREYLYRKIKNNE